MPHPMRYPFQWLWDSCFHSIVWAEFGDDRCLAELDNTLAHQGADGFVPHVTYWSKPPVLADFWGQPMTSTLTQPPMYGHAAAHLIRSGFPVSADVLDRCRAGLEHLTRHRPRGDAGLVPIFHPWESGCDDSARFDAWRGEQDPSVHTWFERKGEMVKALLLRDGAPRESAAFAVGSVGFNALISWNIAELDSVGEAGDLVADGLELASALGNRWSEAAGTWVDANPVGATGWSGAVRTLDSLLPLLVDPRSVAFQSLLDPQAFGAPYGPRGVHRDEASNEPSSYWRGPAWPQLTYLLAQAAMAHGRTSLAYSLARSLRTGAIRSNLSEYWNPETGEGLGARPQSWAGLAVIGLK